MMNETARQARMGEMNDTESVAWAERHFWKIAAGMLAVGLVLRIAMLAQFVQVSPFAVVPINDAQVYWDTAGRMAEGRWTEDHPFFSAPLYEYFVGVVRWLGGGLTALYMVQTALHLVTAALLAALGRRRFGAGVGLLSLGLFLLLMEPAFFATRVLNGTVQLLLVCLAWWGLVRVSERATWGRSAVAGALMGLNCLATPPMMMLAVVMGPWLWWQAGRGVRGAGMGLLAVAAAAAAISPATIHNYRTAGVFIPIQAASGVTFRFGNSPGANGVFKGTEGIRGNRIAMHDDARTQYRERFGRDGNWKEIDDYFWRQGWDYLRSDARGACKLWARKAYWFLTGQHYGDIYYPTSEIYDRVFTRLELAPLPLAWLMGPALVGLIVLARRPGRFGPELAFALLPWAVVTAFWYSPRFRFPATGAIVAAASFALGQAFVRGRRRVGAAAVLGLGGMGVLCGVNSARNFDSLFAVGAQYAIASARVAERAGNTELTLKHLWRLTEAGVPESDEARRLLLDTLQGARRWEELAAACERLLETHPTDPDLHVRRGRALQALGRGGEAVAHLEKAMQLKPATAGEWNELGLQLKDLGRNAEALEAFESALRLADVAVDRDASIAARANLATALLRRNQPGDLDRAIELYGKVLELQPGQIEVRLALASLCGQFGQPARAIKLLREGLTHASGRNRWLMANNLAWRLATCPRSELRNGAEAVRLAEETVSEANALDATYATFLDTLAAAYAEVGRFDDALRMVDRAIGLAGKSATPATVGEMKGRRAYYEKRRPYHTPR